MQVQAVKLDKGWFIKELPGYEEVKAEVIDIEIELSPRQTTNLDYKELRGINIMERYFEKRQRETISRKDITELQQQFQKKFGISTSKSFKNTLREL